MAKYYMYTPKKLDLYKKQQPVTDDDKYNTALIALRRQYFKFSGNDVRFKAKLTHFNKYVNSKEVEKIANIVQYLLRMDKMKIYEENKFIYKD